MTLSHIRGDVGGIGRTIDTIHHLSRSKRGRQGSREGLEVLPREPGKDGLPVHQRCRMSDRFGTH